MILRFFGVLLLTLLAAKAAEAPPEPAREFRGAWVATVYNLNWPSKPGLPVAEQQREYRALLDRAVELKLNALLLQVRPASDALYASKLEPWSAVLTGKAGGDPGYDPLAWAVQETHARGLELHAWFNPFRALTNVSAPTAANHVSRLHPTWMRRYGTLLLTDPGEPAARAYVTSVILDVVRRYDIDGVHIDDYFYPYPVKDKSGGIAPFPDSATWQRYRNGGGKLGVEDWRRDNINQFVEGLYRSIKAEKRWVKFGISPFGIWKPRVPETTEAQLDAYGQLYADSRKWLAEGWCDYFSPQLYWPISPPAQSFSALLEWWRAQNGQGRHLWPGIATERIGPQRPASEQSRQIALTRSAGSPGVVHWEIKSLLQDRGGIVNQLRQGVYARAALVPASPWLGNVKPSAPRLTREGSSLRPQAVGEVPPRWWVLQSRTGDDWRTQVFPATATTLPLPADQKAAAVRALDRFGNLSAATAAP